MTTRQAHGERLLKINGVELCAQTFGDPAAPALLLIGGAEASMDWWDDEFCERLAAGGRHVIRYDTRDTGRSTTFPPGEPPYGSEALLADAVGLLDELGIAAAHIVGVSMGGGIAQHLAVHHPGRVASLTLIATSPGGPGGPDQPDLPPMSAELAARFAEGGDETPDWSDREAVIAYYTDGERTFAGTIPVDEERMRRVVGRVWDRSRPWRRRRTTGSSTAASPSAPASVRSRRPRWYCTAPRTRSSRTGTARRWHGRSPEHGSSRSKAWGTRCRRRSSGTPRFQRSFPSPKPGRPRDLPRPAAERMASPRPWYGRKEFAP